MIEIKRELWVSDVSTLLIKLGGECNIHCPHCHCNSDEFVYNEDLIRWLKKQPNLERIVFNGGEPLLYFETMKRIVSALGNEYRFSMVSNGTILNDKITDWLSENNIQYCVSFDGINEHSNRDCLQPIRWDYISKLKSVQMSSYNSANNDIFTLQDDIFGVRNTYNVKSLPPPDFVNLNFIHEVETAPNASKTMDDVKEYLKTYSHFIELQIIKFKMGCNGSDMFALRSAVNKWLVKKNYTWGVQCSNQKKLTVTLDGRFLRCPYTPSYYGDIYKGYDIEKAEGQIPTKCKRCEIYEYCRNTCIENKTAHECYIAKKMHKFLKMMEEKHSLDLVTIFKQDVQT